jgi:opacity protein-like surface antigen
MTRIFAVAALVLAAASAAAQQPAPSVCSAAAHHQFDFWVGEWSVTDQTSGQAAGVSQIEQIYGGCVIRENWAEQGFRGGSLNSYWATDKQWHQTWMDSAGAFRHFIGGLDADGRMVLTAHQPDPSGSDKIRLIRLTFTPNKDGTVRQYSDYSDDNGANWKLRYDYLYRKLGR